MADDDLLTERLLRVIDEGRRTATYKLALLLALIDTAALHPGEQQVGTRDVAEQVLAVYYPQTRVYVANDGVQRELRQISAKASSPLRAVLKLRIHGDNAGCRSAADARSRLPDLYAETLDAVEETFVRYPIPLLQVVGRRVVPFLYAVDWPEGTPVRTLRRDGRDVLRFLPGVPGRLVVLGPLLRPLIELHWTRDVARWTGVATEEDRLRGHLFGRDRVAFPRALRAELVDLQGGGCFYCGDSLREQTAEVDHFLAWSRWPNDAVENLVVAHRGCNGAKSDHLAAADHLRRWWTRLDAQATDLAGVAAEAGWTSEAARSRTLVRSTYRHVVPGVPLWHRGGDFVDAEPADLLAIVES